MAGNSKRGGVRTSAPAAGTSDRAAPASDKKRIIQLVIKLFLVLAAILLIVALWRNRVDWSFANIVQCVKDTPSMSGSGEGFPVSVGGGRAVMMDELSGGTAVLTDSGLTIISKNAKQAANKAHFMSTPVMKTGGRYALVIDAGNRSYRLETVAETIISAQADSTLHGGAVAHDGSFALVMAGHGALSTVEVHERTGEVVHRWSTSLCYITDAALTADGRYLAMSGVTAEGGKLKSLVIVHRVGVEGEVARFELQDELLLGLEFTNTDTLFAICDQTVKVISELNTIESIPLEGQIVSYDVSYDSGLAVYYSTVEDNSHGRLMVLDTRGHARFTQDSNIYCVAVSLSGDGCALLGRGLVSAYRLSGELIGTAETGTACSDVVMLDSRVYVLEGMNVSQVQLHHDED